MYSIFLLKALAFAFIIIGFLMVFAARFLVKRYALDQRTKCEFASEMSEEELQQYRQNKAVLNIKMWGMLVALPGLVLIFILFR